MSTGEEDDVDRILGGVQSDKVEAIIVSLRQLGCSQDRLGVLLAPTNDADRTAGLAPSKGRAGELQKGGPCQGASLPIAF